MKADETLERVRMALAEVGVSPDVVRINSKGHGVWSRSQVDVRVVWRAREIALPRSTLCLRCFDVFQMDQFSGCEADRKFTEDCGRAR